MKRKINITNQNRERQNIWFEEEDKNVYTIHTTSNYALKYASINYDNIDDNSEEYDVCWDNGHKGIIHSFDPSGGPYIGVGNYKIDGKTVVRIYYNNDTLNFITEL